MRIVNITANASGAAKAAAAGDLVIIVDVISMSTTAEAVWEKGALAIWGAASEKSRPPLGLTNPYRIGYQAGLQAIEAATSLILITEPRLGSEEERKKNAFSVLQGVAKAGAKVEAILPNIGAETAKMAVWQNKIVLLVTDSGGVAFDAAFNNGAALVLTGTIARTLVQKGSQSAKRIAHKAIMKAKELACNITVVAASSNALEDVLAAEYIARIILEMGFLE